MNPYHTVFFDLDGTLTDPKEGIIKSVQYALLRMGINPSEPEALLAFIGPPLHQSFQRIYHLTPDEVTRAVAYYREYFTARGIYQNSVYERIPGLLHALRKDSRRLIVATSKPTPFAEQILRFFGLEQFFEKIDGGSLDGTRSIKSEIIAGVLQTTPAIARANAVMIGDSEQDIMGAQANGMASIAVMYGYGLDTAIRAAHPTHTAHHVTELFCLLGLT